MLFLVALFLLKNKTIFQNTISFIQGKQENGLAYNSNTTIGDLVNRDTDGDGIPDWEESLWGTDPTKKETTPGIPDNVAIEKLKSQTGQSQQGKPLLKQEPENLTQTDKFSREFFSTVATLSQGGEMDQATVDKLSSSLAEKIQNSTPRKIYTPTNIKIINDESTKATQKYSDTLSSIYPQNPAKYTVIDVLQKFTLDENNVDVSVLVELDSIIEQIKKIINAMVKMNVPQSLSTLHLTVINALERLVENISDIKLYDTDVIVSLSAISQYEKNTTLLESAVSDLVNKLNN